MKLHKRTLLVVALSAGSIHLAGCAQMSTMMEENPELACALMVGAGSLVGYAIGDDAGAAIAGAAIGALGCALIQHLGAENAKAVEDWQRTSLSDAPMDKGFTTTARLPASDGGFMMTTLTSPKPQPLGEWDWGEEVLGEGSTWPTQDTTCREMRNGTTLGTKKVQTDTFTCYHEESDRWVDVVNPNVTLTTA